MIFTALAPIALAAAAFQAADNAPALFNKANQINDTLSSKVIENGMNIPNNRSNESAMQSLHQAV